MRIAFVDPIRWGYQIESVYKKPLGGTQSAVCYLAETLALKGHDVFLINNSSVQQTSRGVLCIPLSNVTEQVLNSLDVLIEVNSVLFGKVLKSPLRNCCMLLWTGHAHDQPAMQPLANVSENHTYDGVVLVSDY